MGTTRIRTKLAFGAASALMILAPLAPAHADGNANRGDGNRSDDTSEIAPGRDEKGRGRNDDRNRDDDGDRDRRRAGGSCTTTFQFTGATTIHIDGKCTLLHLGATTFVAEQTVSQGANGTLLAVNETVYTSARGDQLFSHFEGVATPTSPTSLALSGTETYHGGTGRFADANGRASLSGSVQFTSASGGIGQYTTQGRLSY